MPLGPTNLLISGPTISGESFFGYILRLTQWNSYNRISWILNRVGLSLNNVNGRKFDGSVDLLPLARLTGADLKELVALLYTGTNLRSKKTGLFFGNFLSPCRIRKTSPKLCPLCLVEADYHRKIWDLAYVTCCPVHKCLLLDTCPNCSKRVSWGRNRVSVCGCDYDWRKVVPIGITDQDLKLTRQVFKLCGVSVDDAYDCVDESNPLFSLELEDLLSAVTLMSAQHEMLIDASGKRSIPSRTNEELNKFFSRGFAVFEDWPKRYYEFLAQRRARTAEVEAPLHVSTVFPGFVRMLTRSFGSEKLRFIGIAFEHYLKEHWDAGVLPRSVLRFTGSDPKTKNYLTKSEGAKYLGTTVMWIDKLLEEGKLGSTVRMQRRRRSRSSSGCVTLLRRSDVDRVKKYLNQLLTIPTVAKELGVCRDKVLDLVEYGCLVPAYQPGVNGWRWLFASNAITELLVRIQTKIVRPLNNTDNFLTLKNVILRINSQIKIGPLVRAILEDKIAPQGEVKGVGLNRFLFSEAQLRGYLRNEQKPVEDEFSVEQVAKRFGVRNGNVQICIRDGLLAAHRIGNRKRLIYRITEDAINRFESTYVFCGKMISDSITSPRTLVRILREQGVHPVSGPESHKEGRFIFRRTDVKHLDLHELVRATKSQEDPKGTKYSIISGEQVAELLSIDAPALRALVKANKLTPLCEIPGENGANPSYTFRREVFRKYTATLKKSQGLVSSVEAAIIIGVSYPFFRSRWGTGRLPATRLPYGLRGDYFQLKDVEQAKRFHRSTVSGRVAAKMLGIITSEVAMKLNPVAGPKVDGFGRNVYLKSDVEKYLQKNGPSHMTDSLPL